MLSDAKAVAMPFDEAVEYFRQKIDLPTKHWTEVMDEAHARSFAIAGATDKAMLADFRKALDGALVEGTGFQKFRGQFDDIVKKYGWQHTGKAGWRAKVIYETNMRTAYAAGRYAQQTRPAVLAAFPYWQYLHVNCPNPRPIHLAWSGMVLRADDPFWATNYPPNGWGCHCIVTSMNERMMARDGISVSPSPVLKWRDYMNQTTGVVVKVPEGVDPGFAYNPGKAWKEGKPAILKSPDVKLAEKPKAIKPPVPVVFDTPKAADESLKPLMQPWADALTKREANALNDYKGTFGREINKAVMSENGDPALLLRAKILEAALDRAKMPVTVRAWRAVGPAEIRKYLAREVGQSIDAEAFVSTSLDRKLIDKFTADGSRMAIEIIVPAGTRGAAYVHPFPGYRFPQAEVLLNVGTKLTIVRKDDDRLVLMAGEVENEQ